MAVKEVVKILRKEYGSKGVFLTHLNPLQLLVATILSAQCTDARVNIVTSKLFKKYKTVNDYAAADLKTFENEIHSTGFYHNKAKNIINSAKMINDKFYGKVPSTMEDLLTLPGVARKTANIVLTNGFDKVSGIAVDTHVFRLAHRLGWSSGKTADKVEKDLMRLVDKKDWECVNHILVSHGRAVCVAKKPKCSNCLICKYCPSCKKIKGWC